MAELGAVRAALAERFSDADQARRRLVIDEAGAALHRGLASDLLPSWLGTPWGDGPSSHPDVPGSADRTVHCGSLVVSALSGAGLRFTEPKRLALAPALRIMEAIAPASAAGAIRRWRGVGRSWLRSLRAAGDGVYLVGLRQHIAFAIVEDGEVWLLHASEASGQVVREPAATSEALRSRTATVYVLRLTAGPAAAPTRSTRALAKRWLRGSPLGPQ